MINIPGFYKKIALYWLWNIFLFIFFLLLILASYLPFMSVFGAYHGIFWMLCASSALVFIFSSFKCLMIAGRKTYSPRAACPSPEINSAFEKILAKARQGRRKYRLLYIKGCLLPEAGISFGFDRHTVYITEGLLMMLDRSGLEAVLAHEIGHAKSGDFLWFILINALYASFVFFVLFYLYIFIYLACVALGINLWLATILSTAIALFLNLAYACTPAKKILSLLFSHLYDRRSQIAADAWAARLTGSPASMIAVLDKLACAEKNYHNSCHLSRVQSLRELFK